MPEITLRSRGTPLAVRWGADAAGWRWNRRMSLLEIRGVSFRAGGRMRTRVDRRQLETLMAHGLTPEAAVDAIVSGMLR